jgi:asparagine synthase (glutamine-hydrolysing)
MCGIAGIAGPEAGKSLSALQRMTAMMTHRGPDASGVFQMGNVALAHQRLSIIDLTDTGSQPMVSSDGKVAIVFNGEIYNFKALKATLQAKGHIFRGTSDTEVLLFAYLEFGRDFLGKIAGMFSFAIYDSRKNLLLLARDPLGIKPLYVWVKNGLLAFSSEVRSLRASGYPSSELDLAALGEVLFLESPLSDRTPFSEIKAVDPGHWVQWKDGQVTSGTYWSIQKCGKLEKASPEEVISTTRQVISEHLISDVPLGVLLSGGIDSSCLAAIAQAQSKARLRTFCIGLEDSENDESQFGAAVAKRIGTEHHTFHITGRDFLSNVQSFLDSSDFPSVDGLNVYSICKVVKQAGVKVVLSGQGADEIFAGYSSFQTLPALHRFLRRWKVLPGALRSLASTLVGLGSVSGRRAKLSELLSQPSGWAKSYFVHRSLLPMSTLRGLLTAEVYQAMEADVTARAAELDQGTEWMDDVAHVSMLESRVYLHDTLLRVSDVYSMAHSIELRVPFADQRIFDIVNRCDPEDRMSKGIPKPLLLASNLQKIPTECWDRKKKGFSLPLGKWLTQEFPGEVSAAINEGAIADSRIFDNNGIRALWKILQRYPESESLGHAMWGIYVLGAWLQRNRVRAAQL